MSEQTGSEAEATKDAPRELRAVLEERARALAALPPKEARAVAAPRYLQLSVSGEKLALPLAAVRAFLGDADVVPVPEAPPAIRGIVLFEGRVVTVLALEVLLGHPQRDPDAKSIVLLGGREPEIGVAIALEEGIVDIPDGAGRPSQQPGLVVFTLPDGRSAIDVDALARDPRGMFAPDQPGGARRIEG